MNPKKTDQPRVMQIKQKWPMLISVFLPMLILGFLMIRTYNSGTQSRWILLIIGLFYIAVDIFVFYAVNNTKLLVDHDSITAIYPFRKAIKLYFDNIYKIEYKNFGNLIYFHEPPDKKKSFEFVIPHRFSQDDIGYLVKKVVSKRRDIQLDEQFKSYLT